MLALKILIIVYLVLVGLFGSIFAIQNRGPKNGFIPSTIMLLSGTIMAVWVCMDLLDMRA